MMVRYYVPGIPTENKEQAIEWAKDTGTRKGTTGAVIEYKVPKDKMDSLNTKEFSMNSKDYENRIVTPNSELDTMYRNERTAYNVEKVYNEKDKKYEYVETTPREGYEGHDYDVVKGPMMSGNTSTAKKAKPLKVYTDKDGKLGDQTTFNTQKAVDILNDSEKTVTDVGN